MQHTDMSLSQKTNRNLKKTKKNVAKVGKENSLHIYPAQ